MIQKLQVQILSRRYQHHQQQILIVVFGTLNQSASYRMGPSDIFKEAGTLTSGQNVTIISSVKNIDNSNWYKIAVSGKSVLYSFKLCYIFGKS